MHKKIQQFIKYFIITLFLVLITVPLAQMTFGIFKTEPLQEKRPKAKIPKFTLEGITTGSFMEQFQACFNDNFGLREVLIKANSKIDYNLFKSSNNPAVIIGKNDYLFYAEHLSEYDPAPYLNDKDISQVVKKIHDFQTQLQNKNIEFLFVIAPNKNTVYPELMPYEYSDRGYNHNLFIQELNKQNVNYIDLVSTFLNNKNEYPLYYKRDSHWNYNGAFLATKEIVKYFSKKLNLNTDTKINVRYKFEQTQEGDLDNLLGILANKEEVVIPEVNINKQDRLPQLFIYGDSFEKNMDYYLDTYFTDFINAHMVLPENTLDGYDLKNTKIVIFEIVERSVPRLNLYTFKDFKNTSKVNFDDYKYLNLEIGKAKIKDYKINNGGRGIYTISPNGENPSMYWNIDEPKPANHIQMDFLIRPENSEGTIETTLENGKKIVKTIKLTVMNTRYMIDLNNTDKVKSVEIKMNNKTTYIVRFIKLMYK